VKVKNDRKLNQNHSHSQNQSLEFFPFGETLVEEHLNSYNSPFKFNAKEFDAEIEVRDSPIPIKNNRKTHRQTGNYYYGARNYNPKWSIWLSVDPLSAIASSWTPYRFGIHNPVRYIDPTGMYEYDDTYGIDDNGNIRHIDNRKYYDQDGNEVDRLYKMDSKYGTSEIGGSTFRANKYIAYATSNEKGEVNKIFDFASLNSKVEWGLIGFNNTKGEFNYQIGTLGLGDLEGQLGYSYAPSLPKTKGQGLYSIHSHIGEKGYQNQLESLDGDRGVGPQWLNNGYKSYQIYFPSDKSTWSIDRYGRPNANVKRVIF